ncbi:potassium/proton antiporter [Alistipes sp.]|uniref:potassium/proton antiporter n=1 Tax=Alistipes sp. TaxID=1872444 RepID=UPI003A86662C
MLLTTENIILIGALLLLVSVFAGKVAYRFGAPALLLFLGVGMLFGLRIISFNSAPVAQFVGTVALSVILFSGGMDTRYRAIRPVIGPGVVLATAGVALTALIVAGFVYVAAPWCNARMPFLLALLFAATMSSTDSASVFSILRSRRQGLCENLKPLLELESGSNDPMAYILTILLVGLLTPGADVSFGMSFVWFVVGMSVGVVAGYGFGRLAVWSINRLNIANQSLYAVLLLAFVFLTFSVTDMIRGNGYLAVYVAGLVVGNYPLMHKKTLGTFFDGFTWLFQVILFVTLGLLVNIDELLQPEVLLLGGLTGLFMIFVARPAAVFLTLLPFRKFTTRARLYVSWVGLRGAVPIIFATYPVVAGVEGSGLLFNIVFFVTLLSLAVQGTTVSLMAGWLGLAYPERERIFNDEVMNRMLDDATTELTVTEAMLGAGRHLRDIVLPEATLVVMVAREGSFFVPRGNTLLHVGDKLLVVTENKSEVKSTVRLGE